MVLRNYRGERYVWKQPREGTLVAAGIHEPEYGMMALEQLPRVGKGDARKRSRAGGRRTSKRKRS